MSIDPSFAAQLGAFLSTTFVLYVLTSPSKAIRQARAEQLKNSSSSNSPNFVTGAKRYSPPHRERCSFRRHNLSSDVSALHGLAF
mmetsp:Transcript_15917/g.34574  ORF Transcript_15917/g.34574 Transcript_15917/m.34574 type:complete len:85 (+) Transcript_15917:138-392(+)